MNDTKFCTQDPQFSHHCTKFSRPGHLARCIYVPFVSALRVGQVCDVILPSLVAASWTPSRYVVSLLLFSESHPRQPPSPSEPCVSGCSFLPAFRNDTSQHLAVHHRRIFLQDHCSSAVPFGQHKCFSDELCLASSVFRLHVLCATLRELDDCCGCLSVDCQVHTLSQFSCKNAICSVHCDHYVWFYVCCTLHEYILMDFWTLSPKCWSDWVCATAALCVGCPMLECQPADHLSWHSTPSLSQSFQSDGGLVP